MRFIANHAFGLLFICLACTKNHPKSIPTTEAQTSTPDHKDSLIEVPMPIDLYGVVDCPANTSPIGSWEQVNIVESAINFPGHTETNVRATDVSSIPSFYRSGEKFGMGTHANLCSANIDQSAEIAVTFKLFQSETVVFKVKKGSLECSRILVAGQRNAHIAFLVHFTCPNPSDGSTVVSEIDEILSAKPIESPDPVSSEPD
ncbi:MAG: hypothetical protein M3Q07_03345 [Pseudobdellovibrionaceae bacterium]|nr:hypothetical protein [Pseudobdellovibrionaceae bacterium]